MAEKNEGQVSDYPDWFHQARQNADGDLEYTGIYSKLRPNKAASQACLRRFFLYCYCFMRDDGSFSSDGPTEVGKEIDRVISLRDEFSLRYLKLNDEAKQASGEENDRVLGLMRDSLSQAQAEFSLLLLQAFPGISDPLHSLKLLCSMRAGRGANTTEEELGILLREVAFGDLSGKELGKVVLPKLAEDVLFSSFARTFSETPKEKWGQIPNLLPEASDASRRFLNELCWCLSLYREVHSVTLAEPLAKLIVKHLGAKQKELSKRLKRGLGHLDTSGKRLSWAEKMKCKAWVLTFVYHWSFSDIRRCPFLRKQDGTPQWGTANAFQKALQDLAQEAFSGRLLDSVPDSNGLQFFLVGTPNLAGWLRELPREIENSPY